jgi:D-alanine--poly(phosphoribitol) ligase subunit 1
MGFGIDIIERIDHWASLAPSHSAQVSPGCVLSYGELIRFSDILAGYLVDTLPMDKSPVGIIGHKEPEMLVAFLGIVKSGRPYIPIDSSYPACY